MRGGVQRGRCSGGAEIPEMPSLEASESRLRLAEQRAVPGGDASRPAILPGGPSSLRSRSPHSLSRYSLSLRIPVELGFVCFFLLGGVWIVR